MKVVSSLCALCTVLFLCAPVPVFSPKTVEAHKKDEAKEYPKNVLESSVRVNKRLTGPSCGVIISAHKRDQDTTITVLSTGHMRDRTEPEIEIFYLDGKRLKEPLYVKGQIALLVESNSEKGIDFCVIKATVETTKKIAHTPLASADYTIKKGDKLLSVGCDLGIEPKVFDDVEMDHYCKDRGDLELKGWSKVGRSGGGLFTLDGKQVVGICWGGYADSPKSMYTTHKSIIALMNQCGIKE